MNNTLKVIITGATGMVGEGVLLECLQHPQVAEVLIISRKPAGITHPKLKEVIHTNFYDITPLEAQLKGYNACFFCLGISSIGISQPDYELITYDLTLHVAEVLSRLNLDMTFCYISGAGTDSSETSRQHWARVKGKTENDLLQLPFRSAYGVRPGFIKALKGQTRVHKVYKYVFWLFPLGRLLYPAGFCTMQELARAMIQLAIRASGKGVVEGKEIIRLGK